MGTTLPIYANVTVRLPSSVDPATGWPHPNYANVILSARASGTFTYVSLFYSDTLGKSWQGQTATRAQITVTPLAADPTIPAKITLTMPVTVKAAYDQATLALTYMGNDNAGNPAYLLDLSVWDQFHLHQWVNLSGVADNILSIVGVGAPPAANTVNAADISSLPVEPSVGYYFNDISADGTHITIKELLLPTHDIMVFVFNPATGQVPILADSDKIAIAKNPDGSVSITGSQDQTAGAFVLTIAADQLSASYATGGGASVKVDFPATPIAQ